jgi:tetratricopeptide (TPR) repeat protein
MNSESTPGGIITKGLHALEQAEFEDAIELFEQAAVEDSSDANAWFYLGLCYLETGRPDDAIESLRRAVAADSGHADAHYLLGTAFGSTGQIDLAAGSYRRALAIQHDHPKADEFLMRTEALIASREHYRSALKIIHGPPGDPKAINLAIRELLQSVAIFNASPATNEFERLADRVMQSETVRAITGPDLDGPFWASAVKGAEKAFGQKAWPEAAAYYHEALDLSGDLAFIHHALGLIYFKMGDVASGIRAWQNTLDIDPDYDFLAMGRIDRPVL